jgi:hypothetical protein
MPAFLTQAPPPRSDWNTFFADPQMLCMFFLLITLMGNSEKEACEEK